MKSLQINQLQLASNVDAIAGRVNVLAGLKQVREVAEDSEDSPSIPVTKIEPNAPIHEGHAPHDHDVVPESPSLPATSFDGESGMISSARKPSITSRIILT